MKIIRLRYSLLVWLCLAIFMSSNSLAQDKVVLCLDWHNKIDAKQSFALFDPANKSQDEIFSAINCFLQLEGNKEESNVAGASKPGVSNFFGATTVEVASLYYISFLFYQKWDHANAPFLVVQGNGEINTDKAVSKGYKAYKKWFQKVRKVGLEKARSQKMDPLQGSRVHWY